MAFEHTLHDASRELRCYPLDYNRAIWNGCIYWVTMYVFYHGLLLELFWEYLIHRKLAICLYSRKGTYLIILLATENG